MCLRAWDPFESVCSRRNPAELGLSNYQQCNCAGNDGTRRCGLMPKLRLLSGSGDLGILAGFGFQVFSQGGSLIQDSFNRTEIDCRAQHVLFRQACSFDAESELRREFFAD